MSGATLRAALAGAAVLLAVPAAAQTPVRKNECFFVRQFENWKSSADEKIMYIRVGMNKFYRLDLASRCVDLSEPDVSLVSRFRGDSICSALDFDFKLRRSGIGITTPCIVKAMTPMTPAEVAALPKGQKP
ncbi:MAG: hypothetical protein JO256_03670 [Alphaproteobacteria bacterium]|nr:hypothetical protein [Alphaproteobacteria bacterium]